MKLEPTSERVLEDSYQKSDSSYVVYLFHIATYDYAMQFCEGASVLDYGCGSGYGTARLAQKANRVVGVDVAADAVAHANHRYGSKNLIFQTLSGDGVLPFPDASFDVITSFQVIEHVASLDRYVSEARRVLKTGGVFIVVTPDRTHRLFSFQKPWNPWHLTEYDAFGLEAVLRKGFKSISMQHMGGRPELVDIELRRYAWMRLLSLPFTLPFVPEFWRQSVLKTLSRRRARKVSVGLSTAVHSLRASDVVIAAAVSPSVNVVALARD